MFIMHSNSLSLLCWSPLELPQLDPDSPPNINPATIACLASMSSSTSLLPHHRHYSKHVND